MEEEEKEKGRWHDDGRRSCSKSENLFDGSYFVQVDSLGIDGRSIYCMYVVKIPTSGLVATMSLLTAVSVLHYAMCM